MNGITLYIFRQLLTSTVFVAVAVTCAIWLSQSLRLIDLIVNRGVSFTTFLHMSLLMLPTFLAVVLPITLFSAVAFVYNRLTMDSELVVMRAAGLSQASLAKPALLLATAVVLLCYSITIYFLPASFREFKDLQFQIRKDHSAVLLQEGVFNTLSDGITVYVRARQASGELRGILIHDNRVPDKPVTMMAESGVLVVGETGPRVVMINGNRQEVEKEDGELSLLYFDRYTLDVAGDRETLKTRWREPRERFLNELFWPSNSRDDVKNYYKLRAEGHQRLISPLLALAFTCIGLAGLLSGDFVRRGQVQRVLVVTGLMIFVQAAALGLQNIAAKVPSLVPLMYANAIIPIVGGLFVLMHIRRRYPPPRPAEAAARAP
jgi:lipopolysaccharide export system permease protein